MVEFIGFYLAVLIFLIVFRGFMARGERGIRTDGVSGGFFL